MLRQFQSPNEADKMTGQKQYFTENIAQKKNMDKIM